MRPSSWVPPAVWMAVILWLSSGHFSSVHTGSALAALVAWTAPWLTSGEVNMLHGLARKMAHLTAYGILALLWLRAFIRDGALTRGAAAASAFAISVAWAGIDEVRQHFVPSRSGTIVDVAIDTVGSAVALGFAHAGWLRVARVLGLTLLWFAAVGGAAALAMNLASGVPSGFLWLSVPTAALVLAVRRLRLRKMGGPDMAPQTPQPSERPGHPVTLLDTPPASAGPDMAPQTPQPSERPGHPVTLLNTPPALPRARSGAEDPGGSATLG